MFFLFDLTIKNAIYIKKIDNAKMAFRVTKNKGSEQKCLYHTRMTLS